MELDRDFIIDQLERVCSDTKIGRHDIAIPCPFKNHSNPKPSCMVHLSGHKTGVGVFHCWKCDSKGPWSKLAEALGLEYGYNYVPSNPFGAKNRAIKQMLADADEQVKEQFRDFMPLGSVPWEHGDFRGLSEEFLVKVGAKRYYDDKSECHRIVFPVKNKNGKIIGSVARRTDKNKFMSWINAPGQWAQYALFPLHILEKPLLCVVLVEGPFDALRLCNEGIPALAILGTSNWTKTKLSTLDGMGCKRVIICMDGDKAGRIAEQHIFESMEGGNIKRKRFRLPIQNPGIDPGNMNEELVEALREFGGF
jgi:5S rRNA maturation endonuclease (ribonuclease M5)